MSDAIAGLLAWFYELIPNYSVAIVLLTMVVMVVLTPLTMKGTRSMMAMQRLAPEMKKLQERYKDDRETLNTEMMRFYKENKINPLSGCLPLFVQLPVFIILFRVLQGLTLKQSLTGANLGWMAGHATTGSTAGELPEVVRAFDPGYLDHNSALYRDLTASTEMTSFGVDLSANALGSLADGVMTAWPYLLMVLLVGITSWYQQQQIMARNDKRGVAMDPNMAIMTKVMPMMLPIFSVGMPAGLVVYFLASNLYRVGQQAWITRTMDREAAESAVVEATAKEKSGSKDAVATKEVEAPATKTKEPQAGSKRTGGGAPARGTNKKKKRK